MRFQTAVESVPEIVHAYRPGLRALARRDRHRIGCQATQRLRGSIYLDQALEETYQSDPRWDYGVGWEVGRGQDRVIWIEVHPASSSNVKEMTAKVRWLRKWLEENGRDLHTMTKRNSTFIWIASGAVGLPKNSPQARRLAKAGIRYPCKYLSIDNC